MMPLEIKHALAQTTTTITTTTTKLDNAFKTTFQMKITPTWTTL